MTYKEKSSSQRAKEEAQHRLKARESIIFASGNEIIAIEARKHVVFGHTICRVVTATVDGKENDTILNMSSEDALKTGSYKKLSRIHTPKKPTSFRYKSFNY